MTDETPNQSEGDDSQKADLWTGGATEESATERDGFLSYSAEVHAVGHGVYGGLTSPRPWAAGELPDNPDVQAEPHYFKGGFVVGSILQLVFIVVITKLSGFW